LDALVFPFHDYWGFYLAFTAFVLGLLALDLGVFHRRAHAIGFREAASWTFVWISLALLFNFGLYLFTQWKFPESPGLPKQVALQFLTGYLVEESLSVDNMFVFVLVFSYFRIPATLQHRVLFFGILGALIFRAIFIALGAALMQYQWVVWIFGAFLIVTGLKMMFSKEQEIRPEGNPMLRLFRTFLPVTPELHGSRFLVRWGGVLYATPALVALVFLEVTDILFAVDSVPAIYALTKEPLLVFTSNIFAILGLRSLYFLLAGAMDRFYLLRYGLAVVLVFIGLKMTWLNYVFEGHFPIGVSLAVIAAAIGGSIVISLARPKHLVHG
jgi:tellurite resistance protein TerC